MDNDNPIDRALGLRPIDAVKEDIEDAEYVETEASDEEEINLPAPNDKEDTNLPAQTEEIKVPAVRVQPGEDETYDDIEKARSNIGNIIEQGDESLQEMMKLAKQSESPRAFEVAANLMKTLLDANKDYVDMAMKKKYHREELETPKEAAQNTTNVTNNNLIMSTKEILELIRGGGQDE